MGRHHPAISQRPPWLAAAVCMVLASSVGAQPAAELLRAAFLSPGLSRAASVADELLLGEIPQNGRVESGDQHLLLLAADGPMAMLVWPGSTLIIRSGVDPLLDIRVEQGRIACWIDPPSPTPSNPAAASAGPYALLLDSPALAARVRNESCLLQIVVDASAEAPAASIEVVRGAAQAMPGSAELGLPSFARAGVSLTMLEATATQTAVFSTPQEAGLLQHSAPQTAQASLLALRDAILLADTEGLESLNRTLAQAALFEPPSRLGTLQPLLVAGISVQVLTPQPVTGAALSTVGGSSAIATQPPISRAGQLLASANPASVLVGTRLQRARVAGELGPLGFGNVIGNREARPPWRLRGTTGVPRN